MSAKKHGIRALEQKRVDIYYIKPSDIRVAPTWNKRNFNTPDTKRHIEELALSIAARGVKQPLTGYMEDGVVVITDGECRFRATLKAIDDGAKVSSIPVKLEDRYSNEVDHLYSQELRNTGKPFTPAERAELFKALLDAGQTEADIATNCGLTKEYVVNLLKLRTADPEIRQALEQGLVSGTLVMSVQKQGKEAEAGLKQEIAQAKERGAAKVTKKDLKESTDRRRLPSLKAAVKQFIEKAIRAKDGCYVFAEEDVEHLKKFL